MPTDDHSMSNKIILEHYKQAHENRRKWEGYIWAAHPTARTLARVGFRARNLSECLASAPAHEGS
jgi:hypothetical protein